VPSIASSTLVYPTVFRADGGTTPGGLGYTPSEISQAYGFNLAQFTSGANEVQGTGAGQTIAIVDPYDDPHILADLNMFSTMYGLPTTSSGP
jgi:subtilase family serine protease